MQKVRNRWAHYSSGMADKDTVVYDINTLHAFLSWLEAPLNVLDDVDRFMQAVQGSNIQIESVQENEPITETVSTAIANTDDIVAMSKVYLIGNPDVKGMVCSVTDLGEIKKYEVFVNGEVKTFYSGQIALVTLLMQQSYRLYLQNDIPDKARHLMLQILRLLCILLLMHLHRKVYESFSLQRICLHQNEVLLHLHQAHPCRQALQWYVPLRETIHP